MAFVVINSVRASETELPGILADVMSFGLDSARDQPGFRSLRLMTAEDMTEASLIMEWESRDHFLAYRQSPSGRALVEKGSQLHPQIAFYDVVVAVDQERR